MLSNQQIQNNWPKIKSQVLSQWNKLSDSDVEKTHGSTKLLGKLIQEKYGTNMNFDKEYSKICSGHGLIHLGAEHSEMDMAEKSMDKDCDDQYLTGQYCVTKPITRPIKENATVANIHADEINIIGSKKREEDKFNESAFDGFNNVDRHSADYSGFNSTIGLKQKQNNKSASDEFQQNHVPGSKGKDITSGRSNSSANTTSHSALSSSEAMSRDTKKL